MRHLGSNTKSVRAAAFSLLISLLAPILGCTFGSQGLGTGISQQGIYCLRGAVKFTPTPAAIAGGPLEEPALPTSDEDCKNLATGFGTSWKFSKPGDPASVLTWTNWDLYKAVQFSDGNTYCVLKVFVPSNTVLDRGLGDWQAEFSLGDWSVTCPAVDVTYCAPDDHHEHILTVFNSTQHIDGCESGSQGVNDADIVPYPQ